MVWLWHSVKKPNFFIMENQFKFFIVDDDVFCSRFYEQNLRNQRFTDVTCYANGIDCLNNLHLNPDIIFLDHNMEELSGFEVLKKIKRVNPNIYVVMVSGQDNIKTAVDALKYGAFDYVIKDQQVNDNMLKIIGKIAKVKEALTQNSNIIKRIFSLF